MLGGDAALVLLVIISQAVMPAINKGSSLVRKLAVLVIVMMLVNSKQRQIFWMLINILGSPVAANVVINTKN